MRFLESRHGGLRAAIWMVLAVLLATGASWGAKKKDAEEE